MSGYGISKVDSLGFNNLDSLNIQDQYLLAALKSPNIYDPAYSGRQYALQNDSLSVPDKTSFKGQNQNVDYSQAKPEKSNAAAWVFGTIGAATLIGLGVKGKGNPIKGAKEVWNFCRGKVNQWSENKASKSIQMKLINGERYYTIPEKTITIKGEKEVADFAQKYGVNLNQSRLKFEHGKSEIKKFDFVHEIKDKDGKVLRSYDVKYDINKNGDIKYDIFYDKNTEKTDEDILAIIDRINTITTQSPKGKNISAFKNLKNFEYTNTVGDEVITITRNNGKLKVTEIKTPERFKGDSETVKEYFKNHTGLEEKFTASSLSEGKLPEGLKVKSFTDTSIEKGMKFYFNDGKVSGIEVNGRYFSSVSKKGSSIIEKNKDKIDKIVKEVFEEKTVIPESAILIEA